MPRYRHVTASLERVLMRDGCPLLTKMSWGSCGRNSMRGPDMKTF